MLAKQQSKGLLKQVQKAPMLGRANSGVTACLAVVGIKVGRCTGQGKGGSSHFLGMQVPVLNGTSLWDTRVKANHLSKCFIRFSSGLRSRVLPGLTFQSEKLIFAVSLVMEWRVV